MNIDVRDITAAALCMNIEEAEHNIVLCMWQSGQRRRSDDEPAR